MKRAKEQITVYKNSEAYKVGEVLETVDAEPVSYRGFDSYWYEKTLYRGYWDMHEHETYIMLDRPHSN